MGGPYAHSRKTRSQLPRCAIAPSDILPGRRRQCRRQFLYCDGLLLAVAAHKFRRASCALPRLGWQRLLTWFPYRHRGLHAHHILKFEFSHASAKLTVVAISCIREHYSASHLHLGCLPDLLERDPGFGLKSDLFRYSCFLPSLGIFGPVLR